MYIYREDAKRVMLCEDEENLEKLNEKRKELYGLFK